MNITNQKKLTGRERRMQHFRQMHKGAGINLVSMMDIFTILVFFLLANTSSQQLPSAKNIRLPVSVSSRVPEDNLVIAVTKDSIFVQGKKVAQVQDVRDAKDAVIAPLSAELKYRATNTLAASGGRDGHRAVMIMGDETIPYDVLGRILTTCQSAKYTQIFFAAYQGAKEKR